MRTGASQYHPGLTVRWIRHGGDYLSLRSRNGVCAIVGGDAASEYAVMAGAVRGIRALLARRCDAKRAAEVLVGQWWREKCEREARARAKGLTSVRTFTLPAAFFDATVAVLQNLDYAKLVQEAASECGPEGGE